MKRFGWASLCLFPLVLGGCPAGGPGADDPFPIEFPSADADLLTPDDLARLFRLTVEKPDPALKGVRLRDSRNDLWISQGLAVARLNGKMVSLGAEVREFQGELRIPVSAVEPLRQRLVPGGEAEEPAPVQRPAALKRRIVIDPGHGGEERGTQGTRSGIAEKAVALEIGLEVARFLREAGCDVLLTRDADITVPLQARSELSNRGHADLFVSIHANHSDNGAAVQGVEVYTQKMDDRLRYYKGHREPIPPVWRVDRELRRSRELGRKIHAALIAELAARSNGVREHAKSLSVLRETSCPAVLIEVGYMSHPEEEQKLITPAYRERVAKGIAQGILDYGGQKE